jgi:hypothetical protein
MESASLAQSGLFSVIILVKVAFRIVMFVQMPRLVTLVLLPIKKSIKCAVLSIAVNVTSPLFASHATVSTSSMMEVQKLLVSSVKKIALHVKIHSLVMNASTPKHCLIQKATVLVFQGIFIQMIAKLAHLAIRSARLVGPSSFVKLARLKGLSLKKTASDASVLKAFIWILVVKNVTRNVLLVKLRQLV